MLLPTVWLRVALVQFRQGATSWPGSRSRNTLKTRRCCLPAGNHQGPCSWAAPVPGAQSPGVSHKEAGRQRPLPLLLS